MNAFVRPRAIYNVTLGMTTCLLTLTALPGHAYSADLGKPSREDRLPPLAADVVKPEAPIAALAFDPAEVRLLPGPFASAQELDGKWLLSLSPDRLLSRFLSNAGLTPKAPSYGGWESTPIAGHIAGHYLSACSAMYRATGDSVYRERVDYMVSELARCQGATPDGLITAIPDYKQVFDNMVATGKFSNKWLLVPWYDLHKLYAGLRDAYQDCGNVQARSVFLKMMDWAIAKTSPMDDNLFGVMLDTEHGGMAEVAADAYAMTGDKKYLDFAKRWTHKKIMDPLASGRDELDWLHSNTNIPKLIGYEREYELTGWQNYHASAQFFWQTVVRNRTYANGGNGDGEHFFDPRTFAKHVNSTETTETCCTYNMLKLTDQLFQVSPKSEYGDYAERALFNHILASQETDNGMVCYFTPTKPGAFRVYNTPENSMWCCTGTGMENHARYGMYIFYHSPDNKVLYVNQYIAAKLDWKEAGIGVALNTTVPETDTAKMAITCVAPKRLAVKLRKPFWAGEAVATVNGKVTIAPSDSDGYITVDRLWKNGDVLEVKLPMSLRLEPLPNSPHISAVVYGPVLLAQSMGTEGMDTHKDISMGQDPYGNLPALPVSTLVGDTSDILSKFKPIPGQPLTFKSDGAGDPAEIALTPFYKIQHQRYNMYWKVYTASEWTAVKAETAAKLKRAQDLDARTVDVVVPANQQSEVDHNIQMTNSRSGVHAGQGWRDAVDGQFSYTMKVDPSVTQELQCTYWGSDAANRSFDILIDGRVIGSQVLENLSPNNFVDVPYAIPTDLTKGKTSVTVCIKSKPGSVAGGVFGCRILRKLM